MHLGSYWVSGWIWRMECVRMHNWRFEKINVNIRNCHFPEPYVPYPTIPYPILPTLPLKSASIISHNGKWLPTMGSPLQAHSLNSYPSIYICSHDLGNANIRLCVYMCFLDLCSMYIHIYIYLYIYIYTSKYINIIYKQWNQCRAVGRSTRRAVQRNQYRAGG